MSSSISALSRVVFFVKADVAPGETVVLSGDAVPLGGFAPSAVVPMYTTPESYPLWHTKVGIALPRGFQVKYRCENPGKTVSRPFFCGRFGCFA